MMVARVRLWAPGSSLVFYFYKFSILKLNKYNADHATPLLKTLQWSFHHTQVKIQTPYQGPQSPTYMIWPLSLFFAPIFYHSPSTSFAQAFLPFFKYAKPVLTSKPLYLLFPMPECSSHRCWQDLLLHFNDIQISYSQRAFDNLSKIAPPHCSCPCSLYLILLSSFFLVLTLYICLLSIDPTRRYIPWGQAPYQPCLSL